MKKTIYLKGPLLTRSGYGEQARFALRSLRSREDLFDIYIEPIQWGQTSWISDSSEERDFIDQTIEKTIIYLNQENHHFDYSLQVTIPNEWGKIADIDIGYTAGIESTKIAPAWVAPSEAMENIIVVSNHSKDVYNSSEFQGFNDQTGEQVVVRVTTPVTAVNYPVKTFENLEQLDVNFETKYNFLCVSQFGPRKNLENTVRWFIEEFKEDEDVGLVLKTNIAKNCSIDREVCDGKIKQLLSQFPDRKCKVYLLHGDMTDEEMHSLLIHPNISAALSLTHGEGFGLPLFEAAYMGTPVIAPGWSGHMDFLCDEKGKENFYNISYDLQHIQEHVVWEGVLIKESMWAYPRENSAKESMRKCLDDIKSNTCQDAAKKYAIELRERFNEEKMYKEFINAMGINEEEFSVQSWLDNLDIEEID